MIRAMVWKELRECRGLAILALVAAALVLKSCMERFSPEVAIMYGAHSSVPFATDEFETWIINIGGALAVFLGLKQSAWEDRQGVYRYLLHRPISRNQFLLIKVAVGLLIVLAISVGMLLLYARWAATPGNHASPFLWSMTKDAWKVCFVLPIVYLSAMLTGLRPARWLGSRFAPLLAGSFVTFVLIVQPYWQLALGGGVLLSALLIVAMCSVSARRDY